MCGSGFVDGYEKTGWNIWDDLVSMRIDNSWNIKMTHLSALDWRIIFVFRRILLNFVCVGLDMRV